MILTILPYVQATCLSIGVSTIGGKSLFGLSSFLLLLSPTRSPSFAITLLSLFKRLQSLVLYSMYLWNTLHLVVSLFRSCIRDNHLTFCSPSILKMASVRLTLKGEERDLPLGYNAPVLHTILVLVCSVMRFPFFSCLDSIWWTSSFPSFFTRASLQTTFLVWIFLFSFHLLFPPWIFSSWLTIVVILGLGLPALWLCVMSYLTPSSRSGVSMTISLSYGPKS